MSGGSRAVKNRGAECAVIRQPISSNGLAGAFTVAVRGIGVIFHRDGDICRPGGRVTFLNSAGDRIIGIRRNGRRCLKGCLGRGIVAERCIRITRPSVRNVLITIGAAIRGSQFNLLTLIEGDAITFVNGKSLTRNTSLFDSNVNARSILLITGLNGQSVARISSSGRTITSHSNLKVICAERRVIGKLFDRNSIITRSTGDIISPAPISNGLSSGLKSILIGNDLNRFRVESNFAVLVATCGNNGASSRHIFATITGNCLCV